MDWQTKLTTLNKWQDNLQKRLEKLQSGIASLDKIIKQGYINNDDYQLAVAVLEECGNIKEELDIYIQTRYQDDVGF